MSHVVEEVKPKEWTEKEAYECGKGGYRIKVPLTGNPFKGALAEVWQKGWNDAQLTDPFVRKVENFQRPQPGVRREYAVGEKRNGKSSNAGRARHSGRPDDRDTRSRNRGREDR